MTELDADKYWVLRAGGEEDSAIVLGVNSDVPGFYHLKQCKPALDIFKDPVELPFTDLHPENIKTYDFLANGLGLVIVSRTVKDLFDELNIDTIEYISTTVIDHQENPIEKEFYILNLLQECPLIDLDKSKVITFSVDPSKIARIKKLHVNHEKMKEHEALIFRAENDPTNIYITKELLDHMTRAEISGFITLRADGWNGRKLSLL